MKCPDCKLALVILEVDKVELDLCVEGHGFWFDADELTQLFAQAGAPAEFSQFEDRLQESGSPQADGKRRCPRCSARLQPKCLNDNLGPVLDACPKGHGLWFDPGELEELSAAAMPTDDLALARVQEYLGNFFSPAKEQ